MSNVKFELKGSGDLLVVYEDKLTITPQGLLGLLGKGVKGTKTIPFSSISSIELKESGFLGGYIQFGTADASSSRGGIIAASHDENTFNYQGRPMNEKVIAIKTYVEKEIQNLKQQTNKTSSGGISEELQKLAALRDQGILTDAEFQTAKAKLLS